MLAHGYHHPQIVPRQPRPARALHVEAADGLTLVEERDAYLGGHAPTGPDKVRVDAHVFHEHGLPGAHGAPAEALRQGNAFDRVVRPGLMLQHQFLALEQVGASPGIAIDLDCGLDRPAEDTGYIQLVRHGGGTLCRRANSLDWARKRSSLCLSA